MANHKSAIKKVRSDQTKRERNRYQLKTTRTYIKRLKGAKTKEEGISLYKTVSSKLDKLAKNNIIHQKNASNKKSKFRKFVDTLPA